MSAIPKEARSILADGDFCYLAAAAPSGPHLTPVVFAFDGGRLWITTSRGSVKAKVWRGNPSVAGLVRVGDRAVTFRGRVRTYDALDPFTWPLAVVGSGRLLRAATRFALKNARFFFGYAVDATEIPLAWTPPGRIFNGVELRAGRVLELTTGADLGGWGPWETNGAPASSGRRRGTGSAATTAGAGRAALARALARGVPASVLGGLGTSGEGVMALRPEPDAGPLTVLPVRWSFGKGDGSFEARLPSAMLALAPTGSAPVAGLTVDQASTWRARRMRGMLIRGPALVSRPRGRRAGAEGAVVVRPEQVVWWEGWTSGTAHLAGPRARRAMRDPA